MFTRWVLSTVNAPWLVDGQTTLLSQNFDIVLTREATTKKNLKFLEAVSGRTFPRTSRAALFKAAILIFLFCACIRPPAAQAEEPATIDFSLDFPNSAPEHYMISVQADGHAHYESTGKITSDSDERDTYESDFSFADATRARIFELAAQAHYFSGKVDSGNKKIAFTGAKKLTYKDAKRTAVAEYNYSPLVPVQQLTSIFQSVAGTLEYGRRLTYFHRYQKLALDDELKRAEDQARRGEIMELQAIKTVLQSIYDDNSVIKIVRVRALRMIEMEPVPVAGK